MMHYVCFHLKSAAQLEETWQLLESLGCQLLYSSEDAEEGAEIYGYHPHSLDPLQVENVLRVTPSSLEIDWEAQWAANGLDYHDGYVHLDLAHFGFAGKTPLLKLKPGPGFGDLSHPTTRMMLKLMQGIIQGRTVVDIGSGSGVLALAASLMGAEEILAIDIDPEANRHAEENALLNGLKVSFILPEQFHFEGCEKPLTILMNMIWSEQRIAWQSLPALHRAPAEMIISGIRVEERESYLAEARQRKWNWIAELQEDGWLAIHFRN
jgi:ribosomal protein L11 methyltransferase